MSSFLFQLRWPIARRSLRARCGDVLRFSAAALLASKYRRVPTRHAASDLDQWTATVTGPRLLTVSDNSNATQHPDRMASIGVGNLPSPSPSVEGEARKGETQ